MHKEIVRRRPPRSAVAVLGMVIFCLFFLACTIAKTMIQERFGQVLGEEMVFSVVWVVTTSVISAGGAIWLARYLANDDLVP